VSLNPALEDVRFCPRCGEAADVAFPSDERALRAHLR
jgi:ribosomal protein S27AE